jgi:hypothetical protein
MSVAYAELKAWEGNKDTNGHPDNLVVEINGKEIIGFLDDYIGDGVFHYSVDPEDEYMVDLSNASKIAIVRTWYDLSEREWHKKHVDKALKAMQTHDDWRRSPVSNPLLGGIK